MTRIAAEEERDAIAVAGALRADGKRVIVLRVTEDGHEEIVPEPDA